MPSRLSTRSTIGSEFVGRDNSFNLLRLLFASLVLLAHGWDLGGFGLFDIGSYPAGSLAVDGFFVISGFLVTRSYLRLHSPGRYLWHRFLRILPGFWVCLVVTAAVFGTVAWVHTHGTVRGYLRAAHGPIEYVLYNASLKMHFYDVAGTPALPHPPHDLPVAVGWNGSLWTLVWEFLCYLLVLGLGLVGVLSRRAVVAAIAVGVWLVLLFHLARPQVAGRLLDSQQAEGVFRLVLLFLAGSLLLHYADRIPLNRWLALASAAAVGGAVFLSQPQVLYALPLAYLCVWLAIRLPGPFRRIGSRNDLSYGIYIYAGPVQELLALYALQRHGVAVWFVLTLAGTLPLAWASWLLVERPALRLKGWTRGQVRGHKRRGIHADSLPIRAITSTGSRDLARTPRDELTRDST